MTDGHGAIDLVAIAWFAGWLVALGALLAAGARLPLQAPGRPLRLRALERLRNVGWQAGVVVLAVAVVALANVAVVLRDVHIDLTREKSFTPSAQALAVAESLEQPVRLTYFIRGQDPSAQRLRTVLEAMAKRSPLLTVRIIDPDRDPGLARAAGMRTSNVALLEAGGRRLQVETTDENQLAIGIQRVLRREVVRICFIEGHNELPMLNEEFHTHVDGVAGHSHDDAASAVIQTTGHGVGRLRRALEGQGYETERVVLVTSPQMPAGCRVAVIANPRTAWLPGEVAALERWLDAGGSMLAMIDLGYVPSAALRSLFAGLGVALPPEMVVDPLSHYGSDATMVAVSGYPQTPITRNLSMSFFPGARPLQQLPPPAGVTVTPLVVSSRDSYTRRVDAATGGAAAVPGAPASAESLAGDEPPDGPAAATGAAPGKPPQQGPRLLAAAIERQPRAGTSSGTSAGTRAIVVGDSDFASNSFIPYLANGELSLSMVRWLVREERATAVPTRIPVPAMIPLSNAQMRTIFLAVEVALPLSVIVLGGLVWWRRR